MLPSAVYRVLYSLNPCLAAAWHWLAVWNTVFCWLHLSSTRWTVTVWIPGLSETYVYSSLQPVWQKDWYTAIGWHARPVSRLAHHECFEHHGVLADSGHQLQIKIIHPAPPFVCQELCLRLHAN